MARNLKCASVLAVATALFSSSVSAQSVHPLRQYDEPDIRSSVSLTIPLGGRRGTEASKPQLSLDFEQKHHRQGQLNTVQDNVDLKLNSNQFKPQKARIGFTLDEKPRLMMNGKPYDLPEGKANASTAEKVGIGVGALVGIGALVIGTGLVIIATSDGSD